MAHCEGFRKWYCDSGNEERSVWTDSGLRYPEDVRRKRYDGRCRCKVKGIYWEWGKILLYGLWLRRNRLHSAKPKQTWLCSRLIAILAVLHLFTSIVLAGDGYVASTSNPAEGTWYQLLPCHVERSREISPRASLSRDDNTPPTVISSVVEKSLQCVSYIRDNKQNKNHV